MKQPAMAVDNKVNGHTNGYQNGYTNGYSNGPSSTAKKTNGVNGVNSSLTGNVTPRRQTPPLKTKPTILRRIFNIVARLSIWYSILTLLFRCPATVEECNETTSRICKPYFQVKEAVTPHLTPYYDTYAAPYVDLAKPYYDTVDRVVVAPTRSYAVKYGGPQVQKARALGQTQWEKNVQPQFLKYQGLAKTQYDQTVAPHVNRASAVAAPYYEIAKTNGLQTYHEVVLPSYQFVQPYALQGYGHASAFTTKTAVPSALWAWNKTFVFLDSTVWPHVRDVYTVKVEPQLLRIVDRLGRYKDIKPKAAVEEAETAATQAVKSTFTKPSASSAATIAAAETTVDAESATSLVATAAEPASETPSATAEVSAEGTPVTLSKQELKEKAAKEVAEDLELWQGKFTRAADEGASEIEERIDDLASTVIEAEAHGKGLPLVAELNNTVASELASLKKTILSTLEQHKEDSNPDAFEKEVAAAVRGAGLKIKNQAQGIRTWREDYEQHLEVAVTHAAQDHVRILESIRDLALQKIGMKWAWMDGVTYKHWQKFHELREKFDEWVEDLKRLVITHPGLKEAQDAGSDVESQGMAIAGAAAQELGSLKQIAAWKALAGDYTDDFDASTTKLAAEAAQKKAAEAAQALKDAAETVQDGVHSLAEKAGENIKVAGQSLSEGASSVVSKGTSTSTSTLTATVSLSAAEEDTETAAVPGLESLTEEPTHSATDLADSATSAADSVEPLPTADVVDGPEQIDEDIEETPDEPEFEPPVQSATTTVKSALFGAAAQSVPSRQPILDTDDVGSSISSVVSAVQSDYPHTITSAAQSAYTAAMAQAANQYSRAMSAVSVQVSGEPKPVHEEMFASASSAYFGALGAANSQLNNALTAASEGVYGTPTTNNWASSLPTVPSVPSVDWERVQSIAQQNLQDSVNWAGDQYESAKVAIGLAEPTPSTVGERGAKLLDQAKHNYYAGLGVAHARYDEFLSAASGAVSSLTATPTPTDIQGTASSIASVASASASSAAAAASDAAADYASQAGEYVAAGTDAAADYASQAGDYAASATGAAVSAALAAQDAAASLAGSVGDATANAGDSISENWEYLISQASLQIYGQPTPTPWYENLYAAAGDYASQAGDYAASATDAAADYASQAGEYAASATGAAADLASSAGVLAAENISSATAVVEEYAGSASSAAAAQYDIVASYVSELIVGKEPTFSESVSLRLAEIYALASSTAASAASQITESAASAANAAAEAAATATENAKDRVEGWRERDEL